MGRFLFLLFAVASPLAAQFTGLAATDDAQHLYFTSTLRLTGSGDAKLQQSRLYRLGPSGAQLFFELPPLLADFPLVSSSASTGVYAPQISADGSTVGYTVQTFGAAAPGPATGSSPNSAEAFLQTASGARDLGPGNLQLSRNGRWAVLTQNSPAQATSILIDLQSNAPATIPLAAAVASDGTVLVRSSAGLALWKQGQLTPLSISGLILAAAISDDASTIVYTPAAIADPGFGAVITGLIAYNLQSGTSTNLFTRTRITQYPTLLGTSANGQWILYLISDGQPGGQAYLANSATGNSAPIQLPDGELAVAGALTGAADVAWLSTSLGRIVQITLANGTPGTVSELVPATPWVTNDTKQWSPGSLTHLKGPLPASTDQLTGNLLLDGNPLPILSAQSGVVDVQIPWEQRTGELPFLVNVPSASPFQQNELVTVSPIAPAIERAGPTLHTLLGLNLMMGDLSGYVTMPPGPGDVIIGYFTGLGPVDGVIATGQPAPSDTPPEIQSSLTCQFIGQSPMETLSAGLAPGTIGLYQATFRIPADATPLIAGLKCSLTGDAGASGFVIAAPLFPLP